MVNNKNQHYVPAFYFRLFSKDKRKICTFYLPGNKFVEYAPIRGQCSKKYFYSKNTKIEESFSQLEDLASRTIRSIIKKECISHLSDTDIENLKSHILFQYGRTKYAKDRENDTANYIFDLLKPRIYDYIKKEGKDIPWESIKDARIKSSPDYTLFISMMSGILLTDLDICLLKNKSKIDFIFSDNPVVLFNSFFNDKYPYGTTGIASRGLQIFYPINSRFMLFLYDPNYYDIKILNVNKRKDIQRLNGLQILNCDTNIYFENFGMKDSILERYNQVKSKRPKQKNEYEIMGRRITKDGTYRELLRISSPKIHYNLKKLSFLKHKTNSTPYGVRSQRLIDIHKKVLDAVSDGNITSMEELSVFLKSLENSEQI